jgi:tetratricopeptide (TPR) repeat protein
VIRPGASAISLAAAVVLLSGGCATTKGPFSASGKPIRKETLEAARRRVDQEQIPENLRPYYVAMYAEGRENQALHAMRAGLEALRTGHLDLAERTLDLAIQDVEALMEGAAAARRAQSKFGKEQEKWFKGESYERSALFLYRGLIYLIRHDYGNASACFKRAELYDVTGDDAPGFAGDWYSAEWALALASLKRGSPDEAAAALKRAATFSSRQGPVPPPTAACNVLIVVECGIGPVKYRAGEYGELMRYREVPSPVRTVTVLEQGKAVDTTAAAESLYVQATTRGKRQVDAILAGKARFKEDTGTAAVGLATGAAVASHYERQGIATGVLAGLALLAAGLSAATTPQADIRTWDNLPDSIFFLCLSLPPGESALTVEGCNATGSVVKIQELKPVIYKDNPLAVIFVRF